MPEFRLIQISDTHLARRLPALTQNFHRVSEYIDARRPDLVVNSGDLAFDGPTNRDDLEFARELHATLPVACRYLPDRKSTRLNSSHDQISYAVFCLKKKKKNNKLILFKKKTKKKKKKKK